MADRLEFILWSGGRGHQTGILGVSYRNSSGKLKDLGLMWRQQSTHRLGRTWFSPALPASAALGTGGLPGVLSTDALPIQNLPSWSMNVMPPAASAQRHTFSMCFQEGLPGFWLCVWAQGGWGSVWAPQRTLRPFTKECCLPFPFAFRLEEIEK